MSQRIYQLFQRSLEAKMQVGEDIAPLIENAALQMVNALLQDKKILVAGNGPSAALAQMFVACLIDRFEKERPGLPALWLGGTVANFTAIASDQEFQEVYAKQLRAIGNAGDILLTLSTSGNAQNLLCAMQAAEERNMHIIALTGRDGGLTASQGRPNHHICVPINSRSRIHEIHLLILHCFCDLIDHHLFGIE
jgi:D-sedoheptulose 7-phosphate isomerase